MQPPDYPGAPGGDLGRNLLRAAAVLYALMTMALLFLAGSLWVRAFRESDAGWIAVAAVFMAGGFFFYHVTRNALADLRAGQ